jgi:hypothetical protein
MTFSSSSKFILYGLLPILIIIYFICVPSEEFIKNNSDDEEFCQDVDNSLTDPDVIVYIL